MCRDVGIKPTRTNGLQAKSNGQQVFVFFLCLFGVFDLLTRSTHTQPSILELILCIIHSTCADFAVLSAWTREQKIPYNLVIPHYSSRLFVDRLPPWIHDLYPSSNLHNLFCIKSRKNTKKKILNKNWRHWRWTARYTETHSHTDLYTWITMNGVRQTNGLMPIIITIHK